MIELRWYRRKLPYLSKMIFNEKIVMVTHEPPVLQYRSGKYPYRAPHHEQWIGTNWQDVPTVEEK